MLKRIVAPLLAVTIAAVGVFFAVPSPHRAEAQFREQSTYGGTSTGSANAQVIAIPNLATRPIGVPFRFIPGFTNTGPTTINDGLGAVALVRPSSIGNVAFSGGELLAGELTSIIYTGSVYQLASNVDLTRIGQSVELRGTSATAPRGTLIEDGSCVSQTTYAALFSVIGTAYGSCSAGLFALPDSRGTMFAALDNQGSNGAANRITSGGSGCNGTTIGLCGSQLHTLLTTEVPNLNVTGLASNFRISGGSSINLLLPDQGAAVRTLAFTGGTVFGLGSGGNLAGDVAGATTNGGGGAHSILNPVLLGRRAIKY